MIKYLGSKRRLVGVLGDLFSRSGATTALDLFTGTTRVAQELKRRGGLVTAVDTARYSKVFADCYVATDSRKVDRQELAEAVRYLNSLPGRAGYVTDVFCVRSRFFQPFNGERIDSIRDSIETEFAGTPLYPILLTSLIESADRVDSTTGIQMAYVKQWSERSYQPLTLRVPELLPGPGTAIRGDATELVSQVGPFDFAYLDPPYNQHRYYTNYHIWETLVAWDRPEVYGTACKRVDARSEETKSVFNKKALMPRALRETIRAVNARVVVVSYSNEGWVTAEEIEDACSVHGHVARLEFDSPRYVGARIGIHDPSGRKVGVVSHTRNTEYLFVAGCEPDVARTVSGFTTATQNSLF